METSPRTLVIVRTMLAAAMIALAAIVLYLVIGGSTPCYVGGEETKDPAFGKDIALVSTGDRLAYAASLTWKPGKCGQDRPLLGTGKVDGHIIPEWHAPALSVEHLKSGRIVGRLSTDQDYRVYDGKKYFDLKAKTLYFLWVDYDPYNPEPGKRNWRGFVMDGGSGDLTPLENFSYVDDNHHQPGGGFPQAVGAVKECYWNGMNACWIDSPAKASTRSAAGSSQPWVSCTTTGCCCTGDKCR